MIIIKTIILYFIQVTHTDDFPSTGTRLVYHKCGSERLTKKLSQRFQILIFQVNIISK